MATERRLIDAEALKRAFRTDKGAYALRHCISNLFSLDEIVDEAPTVDAVEVVRCEKCLYRSQYCDENGFYKCGGIQTEDDDLVMMVKPDFFCAFGELRCKMDGDGNA